MSFRNGKTQYEFILYDAFKAMQLPAKQDMIVCFLCGQYYRNPTPNMYPHLCINCGFQYNAALQYCMPDILVPTAQRNGIVFVNGNIHDKPKQKKKDAQQITTLKVFGYAPFVITNDEIHKAEYRNLRATCLGIYKACMDDGIYELYMKGEKETPALALPF